MGEIPIKRKKIIEKRLKTGQNPVKNERKSLKNGWKTAQNRIKTNASQSKTATNGPKSNKNQRILKYQSCMFVGFHNAPIERKGARMKGTACLQSKKLCGASPLTLGWSSWDETNGCCKLWVTHNKQEKTSIKNESIKVSTYACMCMHVCWLSRRARQTERCAYEGHGLPTERKVTRSFAPNPTK